MRAVAGRRLLAAILMLGLPAETEAANESQPSIPGFSPAAAVAQAQLEELVVERLDPASTGRHFRYLTEEPHPAGSDRNHELAEYTRDWFVRYGLDEVKLWEYEVLMPWPRELMVQLLEPVAFEPDLKEDGYEVDKDSWSAEVGQTYLGMSASGDVTAEVVYAHSGNPEDYDWLEGQGIDLRGKIAIVRYSLPYSYRGFKAWEAERRGIQALIIYSDPMEDGYRKGEVFPHGPWGPESHIQPGAITSDFIVPGDPLTPGWASVAGAPRISVDEARSVPGIVAVPMSWRDAKPILENLAGPVAPYSWQGGLPLTYHVGPGPSKLRVKVVMDDESRTIQVVTGRIRGTDEPDKVVVLGNHRDAWVYGAVDPSSGSATMMETARILGDLAQRGHRPRRSLVLASWDAEEWHLTGSTEWGEQFADELAANAIAYLNVDSSTSGPHFDIAAVASLNPMIEAVARDVRDPNSRRSLLQTWRLRTGSTPSNGLVTNDLGSGSDYTVFLNLLGIPIVSMSFDGPYGVYHSQFDNYYWMTHFGDTGFRYMTAMVEVWSRMALRLANAEIYPFDFRTYVAKVTEFVDSLSELPGLSENLDLTETRRATRMWLTSAEALHSAIERTLANGETGPPDRLAKLNQALLGLERDLLLEDGIPGRPWFKHVLYAPRYTYAAMSLPGVREAAEKGDWETAGQQLELLAERLQTVGNRLQQTAAELIGTSE